EVNFEGVGGRAEHVDICARTEDARALALDDDDAHLWMLKAQALDGVRQLYVHAQIIRIEFQLVAVAERRVFLHVHRKRGDRAIKLQLPMLVTLRRSLEIDHPTD